jgi:mono/diheme cytochrome c family protein
MAGRAADLFPFEITADVLARGRERYDIYCSPCHDYTGSGRGMIVQRGHKQPPSFHTPRLRQAPAGYYFDVITNGFGAMYDYSYQLKAEERWAVIAWIRTLQASQRAGLADVPAAARASLDAPKAAAPAPAKSGGGH